MSASVEEIAHLVNHLDHPDSERQRGAMDRLVAMGPEAISGLVANLKLAPPTAKEAIVRVLGEISDPSALVPLMRFVYDNKGSIEDADARGLAMRAIMHLARPSHAPKMFDFLMDIRSDADPFVRGWALEAMGKFGDERARPILEESLGDEHDFVRERATSALQALESAPREEGLRQDLGEVELLQKIRNAKDGERTFYLNALLERDDAFELAARLVREGNKGELTGLQLLLQMEDGRARDVAKRHYHATDSDAHRAICLRILAKFLESDASADEVAVLRAGLQNRDSFVRMAALTAGAVSGDEELVRKGVESLKGRDIHAALSTAEALGRGLTPKMKRFVPQLRDALSQAHQLRVRTREEDPSLLEAHLLRALNNLLPEVVVGRADLERDALRSLRGASSFWPVLVSALRILRDTTEDQPPLEEDERWGVDETMNLIDLLDRENDKVRQRVIGLLKHGGRGGITALAAQVERIIHDGSFDIINDGIPLLERSGCERARSVLKDLERGGSPEVRDAAGDALRAMRNAHRVVDASFTRPPEQ